MFELFTKWGPAGLMRVFTRWAEPDPDPLDDFLNHFVMSDGVHQLLIASAFESVDNSVSSQKPYSKEKFSYSGQSDVPLSFIISFLETFQSRFFMIKMRG